MRARQRLHGLFFAVGLALVGGCSSDATLARFIRPDDDSFARAYFDSLRAGRIDYALAKLGPLPAGLPGVRDSLVRLAAYVPAGPLDSLHVIGATRFKSPTIDRSNLEYEYHSAQGWGFVDIAISGAAGARSIEGIHANRLTQSLEQSNAFTFRGKGAGHYLMLLVFLGCFGTAFSVAVLALRTKMKRRWAWALLALVGAGTVMFNWTTGQVGFQLFNVMLFDAAFGRTGFVGPWIFQAAFPVGAVMTWRRVQQARNPASPSEASVATVSDVATEPAISTDTVAR